ncbi:type III secretion system HrpP C-terminal domain-containing protein [Pseudomonas sp. D1-1]|uniref:type III secretion system HrpP C-terminal domain-containing protein n=1 Tax=Pseudomonas sp. D1-1 TaxID=1040793 RepID=UPI003DA84650
MTTPIKQSLPQRPAAPTPSAAATRPSAAASSTPPGRAAETQRNRTGDPGSASDGTRQLSADAMLFMQMLVPPPPAYSGDQGNSGNGSSSFSMFAPLDGIPTQLIDELAVQLPQHGNRPFSATLLMPNLGKVQIRAQKRDSHWDIELGLERADVLERLSKHHGACQQAFAQALEHDVELRLRPTGHA